MLMDDMFGRACERPRVGGSIRLRLNYFCDTVSELIGFHVLMNAMENFRSLDNTFKKNSTTAK